MEPTIRGPGPATPAEAKALAHPLRMRILRLCLEALTNKQLADWLGRGQGAGQHRLRQLRILVGSASRARR